MIINKNIINKFKSIKKENSYTNNCFPFLFNRKCKKVYNVIYNIRTGVWLRKDNVSRETLSLFLNINVYGCIILL